MTPMPEPKAARLYSQVRKRRCAICLGPVVLRHFDEADNEGNHWRVVCPRECQPGGHITVESAEYQQAKDLTDMEKVAANYPEFDARPKPAAEQIERDSEALWR